MDKYFCPFKLEKFHENEEKTLGFIEGHASTFDNIDRQDDIIERGAFDDTLTKLKGRGKILPMLWGHDTRELIGGFPALGMREDDKGLAVKGEINLETQRGREAFSLAKQGVLTAFSIGFQIVESVMDNDFIRTISGIDLMEISLVSIPANEEATITSVKSDGIVPFQDLPILLERRGNKFAFSHSWDAKKALANVKGFTDSIEEATSAYKGAFLVFDNEHSKDHDSYHIQIADVFDGKMAVVPRAMFAAAVTIQANTIKMGDKGRMAIKVAVTRYYEKMGLECPFKSGIGINEIKAGSVPDLKRMLRNGVKFSSAGAEFIAAHEAGRRKGADGDGSGNQGNEQLADIQRSMKKLVNKLRSD